MDIRGLLTDGAHILRVAIKVIVVDDSSLPWGKPSQALKEFVHPEIGYKGIVRIISALRTLRKTAAKVAKRKTSTKYYWQRFPFYGSNMGQLWFKYGANMMIYG